MRIIHIKDQYTLKPSKSNVLKEKIEAFKIEFITKHNQKFIKNGNSKFNNRISVG